MTTVRDVYDFLDGIAPFAGQEPGDNAGLQVGDFASAVESAVVCLDITPEVIAQAAARGAQLIVSHHPVLFKARRQLPASDPAWLLARHGVAAIASHTPLDAMPGGVSDLMAERLGLKVIESTGILRLCKLKKAMPAKDFAARAAH